MKIRITSFLILILMSFMLFSNSAKSECFKHSREDFQRVFSTTELHYKYVLLGDSLTYWAPWNDLLNSNEVANRGIPGDTTNYIIERLDTIYRLNPEKIFLMIGFNDIKGTGTAEKAFKNYQLIIDNILERNITLIIQSTLNCNLRLYKYCKQFNPRINQLNKLVLEYAKTKGITYIDLNKVLSLKNGELDPHYTSDGVHLNMKGFEVWANKIKSEIKI